MANLKEIRIRLNSVKSTRQITSAMKMVSAAKLRKSQDAIMQLRPFYNKLVDILHHASNLQDEDKYIILDNKAEEERILLIMLTSNRGLCGAFNSNIVKRTIHCIQRDYQALYDEGKVDILAIGKKGADQLKAKKYELLSSHHHLFDKLTFENATSLADNIINDFISGKYSLVKIIYNRFHNAAVQEITEETLLPVVYEKKPDAKFESYVDYILEPSAADIFDEMTMYFLRLQFFQALLESFTAEHGARMTAMHKATDNATELIKELELNYNKARQAAITNEILEIVSGAEALKE